jgi:ribosome-binding factor A
MPNRGYSRLARVNEALREVLGDELERIDDDRLELVTITGARVDPDLRHAVVWFSSLTAPAPAAAVDAALARHRVRLQAAVSRQLRLKRTPELTFRSDPAIAVGTRVEDILRGLRGGKAPPDDDSARPDQEEDGT